MIPLSEIAIRLLVATLLSAIVGMERERLECAAGLRTHAMVGLGAALFMVLSAFGFHDILGNPNVVLDPSRMAAQIVSGIGFLGAGLIIFQREVVRGGRPLRLASGWSRLLARRPVENRIFRHRHSHELSLLIERGVGSLEAIESAVESVGQHLDRVVVMPGEPGTADRVDITLGPTATRNLTSLVDHLGRLEGVRQITSER